ncbi:hypothetical protein, conserved [Eimeria tenella]|uniref:Uncharacterized protein n=1 Tax=Eimeria tenella TaxID=5802 RepID=U6KU49_EIMTE|nr:hypothetical protein, conserved [Eimeria tenella]CDJ41682.1 hypothetical protein, conserved [Eimeria tenella]|eukprot:XP_013232432.1 hypothetical protein, conserved [Eimeria tenella]
MHAAMEVPLARNSVTAGSSAFPSLPFLTDAYLPGPHSVAAAQQQLLLLQPGSTPEHATVPCADRLATAGTDGWADPSGAAALHLLGAPRDGEVGDMLSGVQDPTSLAASYFGSYLCSPSLENPQTPTGLTSHSVSPIHLATSPEAGNGSFVSAAPSAGFPLYCGPSFPFSLPNPATYGVSQDGTIASSNSAWAVPQPTGTQDTQGFASDYDRLTRELGKYCATLRDLVTDNPSFSDELNSTLETAIRSADQVTHVQRKLLLSASQQKHLVADSKLIHSKVQMLHRILKASSPKYSQWLEEHAVLRDHIEQLEHQNGDRVGSGCRIGNENATDSSRSCVTSRRRSSSSNNGNSNRRRSIRQYKRQQHAPLTEPPEGLLFPVVKTEGTPSCA